MAIHFSNYTGWIASVYADLNDSQNHLASVYCAELRCALVLYFSCSIRLNEQLYFEKIIFYFHQLFAGSFVVLLSRLNTSR